MKLYSDNIYWNKTRLVEFNFEKLNDNIKTNILIVGAGMSGSLSAYILFSNGFKVTVVEKERVGYRSSSANTVLLQYSSDKRISEFIEDLGEEKGHVGLFLFDLIRFL